MEEKLMLLHATQIPITLLGHVLVRIFGLI
jgi:hypothetical protein